MSRKTCSTCGKSIPLARLKVLPLTEFCINCSTEQPKLANTVWDKTTSMLDFTRTDDGDQMAYVGWGKLK